MNFATSTDYRDALASLQVRIVDTLAGYDEILQAAEADIRPLMQRFHDTHRSHERELSERLRAHGCVPDEDGSFFSTVQRMVIKTRAAFDEIDDDILDAVVRGEERILSLYDEAISAARDEDDISLLSRQRGQVATLVQEAQRQAD